MSAIAKGLLAIALLIPTAGLTLAHFAMLLPSAASCERDQPVSFLFQWGHPFEHQLFDATAPEEIRVRTPGGKVVDLPRSALEKISVPGADDKQVTAYRLSFTPKERGDHTLLVTGGLQKHEDDEWLQDIVKTVLHVQTQNGWDEPTGAAVELVPLTRPYGLKAGTVFQVQALRIGKPMAGALVEVERFNAAAPKVLPPDEDITRAVKADPNGVATVTLPEPGWWCLCVEGDVAVRPVDGKGIKVRQRGLFWVQVGGQAEK